jgi:DNA polymerase V
VTRSFGHPVLTWQNMSEAIATYSARAAEKMRRHKVAAAHLMVFMHTSPFSDVPGYSNSASGRFLETTNDTGEVVALAVSLGKRIWREGFRYAKAAL